MASIIKTNAGIFIKNRDKLYWEVKCGKLKKYLYGVIYTKRIILPKEYIGKKVQLKIEIVENG